MTSADDELVAFTKNWSSAEWDAAEAIETEIGEMLKDGWTKEMSFKFVHAVLEVRKVAPTATVWGVFEMSLLAGIKVTHSIYIPRLKGERTPDKRKKARGKLAGAGV